MTALGALFRDALGRAAPAILPRLKQPSLAILMYHRVLPAEDPAARAEQPGMWVTPGQLAMHATVIREHFEPVHLDTWIGCAERGDALPARALAITFDDGWRDTFVHGFPVLKAARLPATTFLVTSRVGGDFLFWQTRLAELLYEHFAGTRECRFAEPIARHLGTGLAGRDPAQAIDAVIGACKAATDEEMEAAVDESERLSRVARERPRSLLDATEIREMRDSGLMRFGSHSRTHARFGTGLAPVILSAEISGSRADIAALTGEPAPLFCYPNGEVTAPALALVRGTYQGAVTTRPGWNHPDSDRHLLRRIGVHAGVAGSARGFLGHLLRSAFA